MAWFVFLTLIHWIATYPVESLIQPLNNWSQAGRPFTSRNKNKLLSCSTLHLFEFKKVLICGNITVHRLSLFQYTWKKKRIVMQDFHFYRSLLASWMSWWTFCLLRLHTLILCAFFPPLLIAGYYWTWKFWRVWNHIWSQKLGAKGRKEKVSCTATAVFRL